MARGLIKQSKWTSNCGARRQEGRRRGGRADVWSWVSELTGAGQGEGEKTCPLGNHKTPSFSPYYNQHHHSQQHGLILTGLAGVPSAFMWLLVLHRAALKPCQRELVWLFELCIRLICCPLQHYSSLSLSYCSVRLSLDVELSAENGKVLKFPLQALKYQTKQQRERTDLMNKTGRGQDGEGKNLLCV